MTEPGPPPYHVVYSGNVRKTLLEWVRRAKLQGTQEFFRTVLQTIEDRLSTDPLVWGEAQYGLHYVGLTVAIGFHERFQVHFAVDEVRRIVYVRSVQLMPGNRLDTEPG